MPLCRDLHTSVLLQTCTPTAHAQAPTSVLAQISTTEYTATASRGSSCIHLAQHMIVQSQCPATCRDLNVWVRYNGIANNAVRGAFKAAGVRVTGRDHWNVLWGKAMKPSGYHKLHEQQRVSLAVVSSWVQGLQPACPAAGKSSSLRAVPSVGQDMKPAGDHELHVSFELAFCFQQGALQRAEGQGSEACRTPQSCMPSACGTSMLHGWQLVTSRAQPISGLGPQCLCTQQRHLPQPSGHQAAGRLAG